VAGRFWEIVAILAFSRRTQWAILLGFVAFIVIIFLGDHFVNDFELTGAMAPLTESIKDLIDQRYDKAAFACLFSSWALAFKMYRKDKKRFYRMGTGQ
jgi:hypothetical protein